MKKMFNFTIILGVVIMLAGACGYEAMSLNFLGGIAVMLLGALLVAAGAHGKEKYRKYRRRCALAATKRRTAYLKSKVPCHKNTLQHTVIN